MLSWQNALTCAFSGLFSLSVTVGRHIVFSGDVLDKQTLTYMTPMRIGDVIWFISIFIVVMVGTKLAEKGIEKVRQVQKLRERNARQFVLFALTCLLAAWLPYVLTIAPGNVHSDSLASIEQVIAFGHPTNNHHPMFYTLFVGLLSKISIKIWGSATMGVLIYSILQMAVMLFCIVSALTCMYMRKVPAFAVGTALLFYMLVPLFPNYAVTMWKDPIYSGMLLLLSVLLYDLVEREVLKRAWAIWFGLIGLSAMIFRNNGFYVVIGTIVLGGLLVKRHTKKIVVSGLVALVMFFGLTKAATLRWNIQSDFVENIGIPLQQLGYTLTNEGEFSAEDREYLYKLMPEETWNYAYRPCLVDPIKWNPQFNYYFLIDTKPEFFMVWLRGLIHNPVDYIKAYLMATYGFWMPGVQNEYGYMNVFIQENRFGIERMDLFEKLTGFSILPFLEKWIVYIGCGTMLWMCLFACVLAMKRNWRACVIYLPVLLNWGTIMIATPTAFSLRYAFIFALGLPVYMSIPLMLKE